MTAVHTCPGGCEQAVPNRLFACASCWSRLPKDLQRPILATARLPLIADARVDAVTDAKAFFNNDQPRPAPGGNR